MLMLHTRQGTLIIVVAGMSALLATLAVTFAVKVRGEAAGADHMVRIAQARILLNAFMVYAMTHIDSMLVGPSQVKDGLEQKVFGPSRPLGLPTPFLLQPVDPDRQATFNTAWIRVGPALPDVIDPNAYQITALVGSGPTQGDLTPYLDRRFEPRYKFDITINPGTGRAPNVKARISKIVSSEISE